MKITTQPNAKIIARYPLATATDRFFARIFDVIMIFGVCGGLAFWIISTDPSYLNTNDTYLLEETWRYFLISFITFIICFLYFMLLPYFWKGQTLFKKIFKLAFYNLIPTENFLVGIAKHELLIWMPIVVINMILGLTLWSLGPVAADNLIKFLNVFSVQNSSDPVYYAAVVFSTAYLIAGFVDLFLVLSLFFRNKKINFIDNMSNVAVIKLTDIGGKDQNDNLNAKAKTKKINYGLPGEIAESVIDELQEF